MYKEIKEQNVDGKNDGSFNFDLDCVIIDRDYDFNVSHSIFISP
jgi:hypothetical protein